MFANADVPRGLHDMIETAAKPDETTQKSEAGERAFLAHFFSLSRAFGDDSTREGEDSIFSHWLGPSRYFQIVPVIVRWYIPMTVTLAVVSIVDQVAWSIVPGSGLSVGCRWMQSSSLIVTSVVTWITIRVTPMLKLLKRPQSWVFIGSVGVKLIGGIWYFSDRPTAEFARHACYQVGIFAILTLLPMVDALPRRLVTPVARYTCALCALASAVRYAHQTIHPESLWNGRTWS